VNTKQTTEKKNETSG